MNIVLINHYAGSPAHGMEYRPYYFAKVWKELGHNVTIVASSHSHLRTVNPEPRRISHVEMIDGIQYIWLWTPKYSINGIGRALNIFTFVLQLFLHKNSLSKTCKDGVVIASSTYPLDVIAAHTIAKRANAKLVYEVHDLWPLSPIELGGMSPRHPFIRLMQWAEDFAYRSCTCVVSMLPLAEEHMRLHGLAAGKFHYVPNGIYVTDWVNRWTQIPEKHRTVLDQLRAENRFVVCYAGSHGLANGLESMVQSAALLHREPVTFVFVGDGPQKKSAVGLAAELGLENVEFLPPVPKACIPALMSGMDALMISVPRRSIYRFGVSPNKLIDYMMAGRPVVQGLCAGNDMVAESGCGISVPSEDAEAIATAVLKIMKLPKEQRDEMGRRGTEYVLANHDYRSLGVRFLNAIGEIA